MRVPPAWLVGFADPATFLLIANEFEIKTVQTASDEETALKTDSLRYTFLTKINILKGTLRR